MNRRTAGLSVYPQLAPLRWLEVAAAYADGELAKLCSTHWRGTALVPVAIPARLRRTRAR